MFDNSFGHSAFATRSIPFLLSTSEREFLDNLVSHVSDSGVAAEGAYALNEGMLESARVIVDPLADQENPICLCGGTRQLLASLLATGFRLTPASEREETARRADALASRLIIAMAQSAESPTSHSETELDNVYRAELGLPVRSSSLTYDQIAIMRREAHAFANLMGLDIKARIGSTDHADADPKQDVHLLMQEASDKGGQEPTLIFTDRATGGRPAQAGQIRLVNAGTFFASFSVSFLINGERVNRDELKDATALRATLVELGKDRLASGSN